MSSLSQQIITDCQNNSDYVITLRRHFHQYPELAFQEFKTSEYIQNEIKQLGLVFEKVSETGIVSIIKGKKPGPTVALRADMDALEVAEKNDVPYKSRVPDLMHACGHDGHMAALLVAMRVLSAYQDQISGTIEFIFQPAEEGKAGAKRVIEEGFLYFFDAIFGLHLWSFLLSGILATRKGPFLASADIFKIILSGKGGHAAAPHQTIDSTAVAADIYNALQKIISREIDPLHAAVISSPVFEASRSHNIIPDSTTMEGTFRALNTDDRNYIKKRIEQIVEGYCVAWRCSGKIEFFADHYPVLVNHREVVEEAMTLLKPLAEVTEIDPVMVSEDFAFYLEQKPGAFFLLGVANQEKGIIYPHHHPRFDLDESVLWKAAAFYALLGLYFQ
ncbi:MAG: amidohydrolase [Spirochaetes bacterium]|nr:amidohydrolase [Spirochaetota bacterium]